MQGKDFRFFIIDAQGRSYFVENGLVKTSTSPKELRFSPDGWQKLQITWERNNSYFGIVRNFTLPLSFVQDGATIINTIVDKFNFEEKVFLYVTKNSVVIDTTANEYFFFQKYYYKGEIDLSTHVQNSYSDGGKVQVNIMEGGPSKYLKSRQNTTYEIACNSSDADCIPVRFNGINFRSKLAFTLYDLTMPGTDFGYRTIGLAFTNEDGDSLGIYKGDQQYGKIGISTSDVTGYVASSTNYFFLSTKTLTINLKGFIKISATKISGSPSASCPIRVTVNSTAKDNFSTNPALIPYTPHIGTAVTTHNFDLTFTVAANEKLFIVIQATSFDFDVNILESNFGIYLTTTLDKSIIYAQRASVLFDKQCKKMTDNLYGGTSSLLSSKPLVVTSGNAIRQLTDATIKSSVQDFFNSFNCLLNVGLSNSDTSFYLEEKATFFDTSNVIALGKVKDFKRSYAKDFLANTIKIGYPNQSTVSTTNGKEEFNNTHLYQLPINRITKELNLVSPYRTDGYGIEQIRFQTQGTEKVSNPSDNDTFILEIDDTMTDGAYNVRKLSNSTVITGLFAQNTAYNLGLSPKRIFRNHTNYFASILDGFAGGKITFQTTEQNANLKTVDGSIVYKENADVTIGDTFYFNKPKLFKPVIFEFDVEVPINLIDILQVTPNACFSFEYNGYTFKGFLMKASIEAATNDAQQFTLLSAPDNDLKLLING